MSEERCIVPNCYNSSTTGISFPKQECLRAKWLKSLQISEFLIAPNSFVCLDHFGDEDDEILNRFKDNSELQNALETLPIPTLFTKNELTSSEQDVGITIEIDHLDEIDDNFEQDYICRLCLSKGAQNDIFNEIRESLPISTLITTCIPTLKILQNDAASHLICTNCLEILSTFYKFRQKCLKIDKQQHLKRKRKSSKSDSIDLKKVCSNVHVRSALTAFESNVPKTELDRKFEQVEAELMKALEGHLPESIKSADSIILQVQSDDEESEPEIVVNDNMVHVGSDVVKLPKGIKISKSGSKGDVCTAENIVGLGGLNCCLVNNYLFEYRLCKGHIRYLKCLVPKCKSIGEQSLLEDAKGNNVLIKIPHNHGMPSEEDRKKQIFLHVMNRKMQNDRSLNFRNVYEEFCQQDPDIRKLLPLKSVINQICSQQMSIKIPKLQSFEHFFDSIENNEFQKLHFTQTNVQFYQERFVAEDGAKAMVFANSSTIEKISDSKLMYVDASFKIGSQEQFDYHLVSVLVWVTDSYYPIMFALISKKSQEIFKQIFSYLRDRLAPNLKPEEIVTDYESSLYYALGEVYLDSNIGGSVFYYTQNLYKKVCSLNLSRELETNSCFRNIYHMLLMLPLLPVNTILDGLNNIHQQAMEMGQLELSAPIFDHVKTQWINKVTPELFCVHRLENRINENIIAPFKKLRDFIMLPKGKMQKHEITIISMVEKLIELEAFLSVVYSAPSKKSFARDLSSSQKKNVIRAWQFIENHPKINLNNFFTKVLGYIKCMENQLWIWGFYRYNGDANEDLIDASNFSIVNSNEEDHCYDVQTDYVDYVYEENNIDVVINQKDGFLIKEPDPTDIQMDENVQEEYVV